MQLIHLIADYGVGDPAFSEVIQKLNLLSPGIQVLPLSVPKFSTIATGFWTYQLSVVNSFPELVIYTNTAPRKDTKEKRSENEGEKLIYSELKNGVKVIGVNAGFCFSFIKPEILSLYEINVANKGSQFRSRDFYPNAVIGILNGEKKWIGGKIDISIIPDIPEDRIAWIDGYGNIKTTMRLSKAPKMSPGDAVLIEISGVKRTAFFTDGTFSVREGELAFAPGSSGGNDRFMEIFLRGLSAFIEFGKPSVESAFSISKQ